VGGGGMLDRFTQLTPVPSLGLEPPMSDLTFLRPRSMANLTQACTGGKDSRHSPDGRGLRTVPQQLPQRCFKEALANDKVNPAGAQALKWLYIPCRPLHSCCSEQHASPFNDMRRAPDASKRSRRGALPDITLLPCTINRSATRSLNGLLKLSLRSSRTSPAAAPSPTRQLARMTSLTRHHRMRWPVTLPWSAVLEPPGASSALQQRSADR